MLTFLIDKTHCTQIYYINLAQNKLTESQRRKLKLLQIIRLSDLLYQRFFLKFSKRTTKKHKNVIYKY